MICWERSFISKFITFYAYILILLKITHNIPDCPYDSNQKVYIYIKQERAFHDHCKIILIFYEKDFILILIYIVAEYFFQRIPNIEQ